MRVVRAVDVADRGFVFALELSGRVPPSALLRDLTSGVFASAGVAVATWDVASVRPYPSIKGTQVAVSKPTRTAAGSGLAPTMA